MGFGGLGRRAAVAVLTACILVTGCGSGPGSDAGSGDTKELSSEAFSEGLTQATASFRARTTQIKADSRDALKASDQDQVLDVYQSLLDATKDAAERYHELNPPSSVKSEYASLLKSVDGQVEALDQVVRAAKDKDSTKVAESLRRYAALLVQYAADLSKLGGVEISGAVNS